MSDATAMLPALVVNDSVGDLCPELDTHNQVVAAEASGLKPGALLVLAGGKALSQAVNGNGGQGQRLLILGRDVPAALGAAHPPQADDKLNSRDGRERRVPAC